jgi:UDP-N-acetylglucosamine 2-epimerase (non-hydrolysing)
MCSQSKAGPAPRRLRALLIFGTRPEAIKVAPVVQEFERRGDLIETLVCTTGQHREMLAQMLEVFQVRPQHSLSVMKPGQTPLHVTTEVLAGVDTVLAETQPDVVLVQGDTTTAFAAALAAFYRRIPVAHIEAGLRTDNRYSPFPEEINRRLVTHIAEFHFAPTEKARANLVREGIDKGQILVTGNTVVDALLYVRARVPDAVRADLDAKLGSQRDRRIVVVTAHRRESFGGPMLQICEAVRSLAVQRPDVCVVYPVHLNPNVAEPVHRILSGLENVKLLPPMDYVSFVALMDRANILLTDSGGIQEEGPCLGKPVLVMREVSERGEAIEAGTARLVGTDARTIVDAVQALLDDAALYRQMTCRRDLFGDGHAAPRIADFLLARVRTAPASVANPAP